MSQHQQQMDPNEMASNRTTPSYAGYEGVPPHYSDHFTSSYGEKLSEQAQGKTSKAGHRNSLLAIASLVLWLLFFLFAFFVNAALYRDPMSSLFGPFVFIGLLLFTALIIVINIVFYRGKR